MTSKELKAFINNCKMKPCMDCGGIFDPVCMDFDHRPGETKLFNISHSFTVNMGLRKRSGKRHGQTKLSVVQTEMAKCDLICSNCHRIRTFKLRNHVKACRVYESKRRNIHVENRFPHLKRSIHDVIPIG